MTLQKKLFVFKVANCVDIITNSSSELFVLKGETKEFVEEMIRNVYPDYRVEYEALKDVREMTNEELDDFLDWVLDPPYNEEEPCLTGFTFDELWVEDNRKHPSHRYKLRANYIDPKNSWNERFVIDENRERVINGIEQDYGRWFLYSISSNPDWDYQEKLMDIGLRI